MRASAGNGSNARSGDSKRRASSRGAALADARVIEGYRGVGGEFLLLRRHRRMTQKQLEDVTGIPQSEISRIESGHANPTLATLRTLVRGLGGEIRIMEHTDDASTH